ncbi:membrane dipeptidase [Desulfonema ishimotonii]|uniref:Membrane dipeptidase n=1 Tax=Desulfonema ishimotonii TaxID=45657 RepID=A0A401FV26_9BACT|nr:dipeptidase [Desulfonema ishimotonii]GBC60803.1 membrane dipeptidase [Desulfonema ishimotonii]
MDNALKEHVDALHRKALTVDAHFDLTYDVASHRDRGHRKVIETDYLEGFRTGGFDLIVSSLFINDSFLPEMGLRKALDQISYLFQEMDESPGTLRLCKTVHDIAAAREAGQIGILLSFEGADPLVNDINLLRVFHELGVRGVGLVWSRRNYVADGCAFDTVRAGRKGGLTAFGVAVVEQAEKLGMFIDVSHLNDEGFYDVMEITRKPVIASHSNCRALTETMRNLTDEQIRTLARRGGVVGVSAISRFAGDTSDGQRVTVENMLDHVDHIAEIAGVEHVGLGFDFCDSFRNFLTLESPLETYDVIGGHRELAVVTAGLIRRGYSDSDIGLILGGNFMRVYAATIG